MEWCPHVIRYKPNWRHYSRLLRDPFLNTFRGQFHQHFEAKHKKVEMSGTLHKRHHSGLPAFVLKFHHTLRLYVTIAQLLTIFCAKATNQMRAKSVSDVSVGKTHKLYTHVTHLICKPLPTILHTISHIRNWP